MDSAMKDEENLELDSKEIISDKRKKKKSVDNSNTLSFKQFF